VVLKLALAAAVIAALSAPGVATAGPPYGTKDESYIVPTRHGELYVEVVRPVDAAGNTVRGPAIFTLSPYSILGRNGDASRFVPRGYARVWADVVGTGNSGGCYDYGGRREQETGYDLVEWIARQPWSTGKVAMIGGSYNATTATATAVMKPPHLTTIVPEAGISRWYEYAYSGGIRYFLNNENPSDEGIDTPLGFDFGFAVPPPLDVGGPDWAERVKSTVRPCDELAHTQHGYDDTPDYDAFWLERDYIVGAPRIKIPVLVALNWGDWNVKQENGVKLYRALTGSANRKLYVGTRWHGHGRPGGDYQTTVDAWFDHYLLGVPNGIERTPDVHSEMSTYDGALGWYAGPWPRTTGVTLFAQHAVGSDYEWRLLPSRPSAPGPPATFVSTGTNTESFANSNPRANSGWLWFEAPRLARDVRIFGEIQVRLWSTIERRWITYTPTVVDVDPSQRVLGPGQAIALDDRGLYSTTRGWLDTRYRQSLSAASSFSEPGVPFATTIVEKPQDYTFKQGHFIGLNVQTEIDDWSLPKPYPDCTTLACNIVRVNWENGETTLTLPVVDAPKNPALLFAGP
jgi:X-Pro dipeptidyl-peptidase